LDAKTPGGPNGAAARLGNPRTTFDWKIQNLRIDRHKVAPVPRLPEV
jgi:hypothetical protein